jgi:hypothetical protein
MQEGESPAHLRTRRYHPGKFSRRGYHRCPEILFVLIGDDLNVSLEGNLNGILQPQRQPALLCPKTAFIPETDLALLCPKTVFISETEFAGLDGNLNVDLYIALGSSVRLGLTLTLNQCCDALTAALS